MMLNKKKQSNISQPTTQPQRPRRFIRRNSIHTLHCRSGSLNKLPSFQDQLLHTHPNPQTPSPKPTKRRQTFDVNCNPSMSEFEDSPQMAPKRVSGSMQVKSCCRDKQKLREQFQQLKHKYEKRGRQLEELEGECRKLSIYGNDEHNRRKNLEEELKLNKQELKRIEKRAEKYRNERDGLQKQRDAMAKHIDQLQTTHFSKQVMHMQNYREQVLENQLKRVKEILQRSRSTREQELLGQVQRINDQKYNTQMLFNRLQVANNMLTKQLQQSDQVIEEMRESMTQAVTSSVEYMELRDRYRKTLLEMRDLRKEIMEMERSEGSSVLSQSVLSALSQSICLQQ